MLKNKFLIRQNFGQQVFFLVLFLFCIQKFFFFSSGIFEKVTSFLTYPIVVIQERFTNYVDSYYKQKESTQSLNQKIDHLQKDNEVLLDENVKLKSALSYLENVSELIEFRKRYHINAVETAQIMVKNISSQNHYCYIDKGSNNNITKDMVAIYKNCIIGRVAEVFPQYSKLIYITDKSCKIAAFCFKTGAVGIYNGSNKIDSAELNYVNHLSNLENNDLIISSGEGLVFPQGFALGKISKFSKDEIQYKITIEPIIDINTIKYCQLIKK